MRKDELSLEDTKEILRNNILEGYSCDEALQFGNKPISSEGEGFLAVFVDYVDKGSTIMGAYNHACKDFGLDVGYEVKGKDAEMSYRMRLLKLVEKYPLVNSCFDSMSGMAYIPLADFENNMELQTQINGLLLEGSINDDENIPHNFALELDKCRNGEGITVILRDVVSFF